MGGYFSSNVQTFFPDTTDPYLRLIVRCKIVTETISIPTNILLLILFHRLYIKKHQETKETKGEFKNQSTVILTYLLLIFGAIFGILQGFFENFALTNCADIINTYFEFFFYIGHRVLLLLIFLNRLYVVFKRSDYKYPDWVYFILLILIIINGILSFLSHSFNLAIMKVPSGWNLWNDGDKVCAWQFGPFVTHITRPIDFGLSITILFLFLYKLYVLHKMRRIFDKKEQESVNAMSSKKSTDNEESNGSVLSPSFGASLRSVSDDGHSTDNGGDSLSTKHKIKRKITDKYIRRRREHSSLEIVARRMSILTFVAIISSIIVTGGYLGYYIRIIGALWPFDIILNSYCCILMFRFTNFMINPCFGRKCDRCCCIKYLGCCDCVFIGKCCISDHLDENDEDDQTKTNNINCTELEIRYESNQNAASDNDTTAAVDGVDSK